MKLVSRRQTRPGSSAVPPPERRARTRPPVSLRLGRSPTARLHGSNPDDRLTSTPAVRFAEIPVVPRRVIALSPGRRTPFLKMPSRYRPAVPVCPSRLGRASWQVPRSPQCAEIDGWPSKRRPSRWAQKRESKAQPTRLSSEPSAAINEYRACFLWKPILGFDEDH